MILDRFRLTDRVAVVTGAGRGIGEAIALAFAEAGADVVCAARTPEQVEAVAEQARSLGRRALAVPCDVTERAQLELLVKRAVAELGGIDILVNNAGGAPVRPFLETSEEAFEEALRFNITAAFGLTRLAVPHLLERGGGAVLNIGSAMGHLTDRGFVAYGTGKAGLDHMTRLLAAELAPRIRVNGLAPGAVETSALAPFLTNEELRTGMEKLTPLGRIGRVEDITPAALFLCSPAGSWVTGKIFEIDGGTVASSFPFSLPDL